MLDHDLLTPEEVSTYLRVPVGTLYSWRGRNVGPRSVKVGRFIRYRRADLEQFVSTNRVGADEGDAA